MRSLLRRIRDDLLATPDTVCLERARLVTEAYQRHASEPPPLRRARAFAHVLDNMSLDLRSNPFFAGNTSSRPRAWMLVPEHGITNDTQVLLENDGLEHILDGAVPRDILDFWQGRSFGGAAGVGHLAVDFGLVVHRGLEDLIAEARRHNAVETDPSRRAYREGVIVALEAVCRWAGRYAEAAAATARAERDPLVREALLRVARACRQVPAEPARDLFEALQGIVLAHLATVIEGHGMSISIGLPDRVLAPFVHEGLERDFTTSLLGAFVLKIAANSFQGRGSKTQPITVGGRNHRGEDQSNLLTRLFLDAFGLVRVGDPHLFLRWHEGLPADLRRRAAEMLTGGISMPLLISDEATAEGLVRAGVREEDAWDYCVIGCNELGIPGRLMSTATATIGGTLQHLGLLNEVLLKHPDPDCITSVGHLLELLEERMVERARQMRRSGTERWGKMASEVPTPFTSALMDGCIERGEDLLVGMPYWIPGLYERGVTNAANALAAIERVVFRERAASMSELVAALRDDLPSPALRARLLAAPKWGNDDERADRFALALLEMRERVLGKVDREFGHPGHTVCHVVRSLHRVDGCRIAASPDGRKAGAPVADSIGAQTGTARNGPTAILRSVLKIHAPTYYRGGYNLNLTLPASDARPEVVLSLVEGFFAEGGQEVQVNCLDAATLRAAQADPVSYRDLVVRVAGFCARFVDLSAAEQEELIERAEAFAS